MRKYLSALLVAMIAGAGLVAAVASPAAADSVTISGVVQSATGTPLPDVFVFATGGDFATTDTNGAYSMSATPGSSGTATLSFGWGLDSGAFVTGASVAFEADQDLVENLTMPPLAGVDVTVLDSNAAPVSGATVTPDPDNDTTPTATGSLSDGTEVDFQLSNQSAEACTTDTNGLCTFNTLLGATVPVRVTSDAPTVDTTVSATTDPTPVTISLPATVTISGVVQSAAGAPLQNVLVRAAGGGSATTDGSGAYSVQEVPGTTSLTFAWTLVGGEEIDGVTDAFADPQDVTENLSMPPVTSVNVTVVNTSNAPVPNATVTPDPNDNATITTTGSLSDDTAVNFTLVNQSADECTTDANGHCTFHTLLGATVPVAVTTNQPTVFTSITASSSPTVATISVPTWVDISGVVHSAAGGPVANVLVHTAGGQTSTTNSNGFYTVPEIVGTTSLTFTWTLAGGQEVVGSSGTFLNQTDVTENVTMPVIASVNVTVVDNSAAPVANATVTPDPNNDATLTATGSLSDGTPVSFAVANQSSGACTTDTNGHCTTQTILGVTLPIDVTSSAPTVSTDLAVTSNPTNVGIGIADLNTAAVGSVGATTGTIQISSPVGTTLSDVSSGSLAVTSVPSGAALITGALSYQVSGVDPGATADVVLQLPSGSNPSAVYKGNGSAATNFSSHATIAGNQITLHVQDGGPGDADGVANGVIVDPILPLRYVVPRTPPSIAGVPGVGKATVSWVAPQSGGRAIDAYRVTPYVGGIAQTAHTFSASATTQTISGLTRAKGYAFKVAAHNALGWGSVSSVSNVVTIGAPLAPATVTAVPGNAQASVTWAKSANTNGAAIDAYRVTPYASGTALATRQFAASVTTAAITGLTNTVSVTFRVQAHNSAGWSPLSPASAAVTVGAPGKPTTVTAVVASGNGNVTVAWHAPATNGGAAIAAYEVIPSRAGIAQPPLFFLTPATSHLISGLTSGAVYTFRVLAHNSRGWGPSSASSPMVVPH